MKKNIPITCLIALTLSSTCFAKKASDETIDILSAEAGQTDMSEAISTTPEVVEPAVKPSQDSDTDELSASITKQLSSILGSGSTGQDTKETEEKLEQMVSSALLEGVDMNDLRSVVNAAMEDVSATQEAGDSKKIKQASQSLNKLVGKPEQLSKVLQEELEELVPVATPVLPTPATVSTTKTVKTAATKETPVGTVTVLEGESLYKLALRIYGRGDDYLRLYNANKDTIDDPNIIRVGQILRIP